MARGEGQEKGEERGRNGKRIEERWDGGRAGKKAEGGGERDNRRGRDRKRMERKEGEGEKSGGMEGGTGRGGWREVKKRGWRGC